MEEHQNVQPSTGTTEWNHSHYTGTSLSALLSLPQLHDDTVSTSVLPLASTQETNGTASSGSVSGPQLPHSLISSQVPAGPTRNVTGEVMPTSLAEAVTQLSFPEFSQRCNLLIAPPQPPQLPVPISLLDAAVQTLPHSTASQDVSTQLSLEEFSLRCVHPHNLSWAWAPPSTHNVLCSTCSRPVPSLLLDAAVQTPLYSVASHDASTHLLLTEFFIGCIFSKDRQTSPSAHYNADSASPSEPADIATLCRPSSANWRRSRAHHGPTCVSTAATGSREVCPSVHLTWYTCSSGTGATSSVYIHLSHAPTATCQYHPSGNTSCAFSSYRQEKCKYRPCGNPQPCWCRSFEQGLALFLNHEPWFFLWSTLVNLNLMGTVLLIQPTVISCIINIVFLSFSGIQAWRAEIPPILLRRPVEGSMRLFFKKPVIMTHTSPISSLCALATRTLLSCSIRTPLSLTPWSSHTSFDSTSKGT